MTDLLPCPFCGSEAVLVTDTNNGIGYFVRCEYCQLNYPTMALNTAEKAVALWNERLADPLAPVNHEQRLEEDMQLFNNARADAFEEAARHVETTY